MTKSVIHSALIITTILAVHISPLAAQTMSCPQTLNFGKIAGCTGAHSVTLSPTGSITPQGCLTTLGGHNVGRCTLSDLTDTATITIDNLSQIDGPDSQQMNLDSFMMRAATGGSAESALIVTPDMVEVDFDFTIGATLHVSSTQKGGHYDGLYSVTVNYE